ncbi:hypothetical protein D3C75_642630 [compost metagenome]
MLVHQNIIRIHRNARFLQRFLIPPVPVPVFAGFGEQTTRTIGNFAVSALNQMLDSDIRPLVLVNPDHRNIQLADVFVAEHNWTVLSKGLNILPGIFNGCHDHSVRLLGLEQIQISQFLVLILIGLAY